MGRLDETVKQGLRLGVDPVEILEDEEDGLVVTLPQEQALDGVERALPALGGIEPLPLGVLDGHLEEGQQGGQGRLEGPIQREELSGHLLSNLAVGLAIVDLEVGLEQVDDRQPAGRLAVGHRARFQDEPLLSPVGVGELVDQAGLPHAGFSHDGDQLAVAFLREDERPAELLDLGVAADEPGQSPSGGGLQPGPLRARSDKRVELHRL